MLKVGFARLDITPPLGTYVAGYFQNRYAKDILDFSYLNALAVSDETETAIIITADILGIYSNCADKLRSLIEDRTGVPANHVMLSALHQHTSVCLSDDNSELTKNDEPYFEVLCRKFVDVAQMALADMKEATLSRAEKETEKPISFIRRYLMKDGSVVTNPAPNKDNIVGPCGEADNTVRLLRFKRKNGNDIALVNFSTHADVIGGEVISADWPGFARRFVEEDLEGVSCIFICGAQGDTNHLDIMSGVIGRSYSRSEYMGRMVADAVVKIWDKTTTCENISINSDVIDVYNRTRTDGEEKYEECKKILDDYYNNGKRYTETILAEARRIVELRSDTIYRRLPVTVVSLGEVALVGFGGEPFTHYATAVREACPDKYVIAACCTNGYAGYLPTASAFAEGGYEARGSRFTPTLESECVSAAANILKKI